MRISPDAKDHLPIAIEAIRKGEVSFMPMRIDPDDRWKRGPGVPDRARAFIASVRAFPVAIFSPLR